MRRSVLASSVSMRSDARSACDACVRAEAEGEVVASRVKAITAALPRSSSRVTSDIVRSQRFQHEIYVIRSSFVGYCRAIRREAHEHDPRRYIERSVFFSCRCTRSRMRYGAVAGTERVRVIIRGRGRKHRHRRGIVAPDHQAAQESAPSKTARGGLDPRQHLVAASRPRLYLRVTVDGLRPPANKAKRKERYTQSFERSR